MLRALGHEVIVSGYDLTELGPGLAPVDVVIVEAREHLEIGRQAIQRLRQRPELMAARFLLCLEVARVVALTAEMGADDFILMPATRTSWRRGCGSSRPVTVGPARRFSCDMAISSSTARCGRLTGTTSRCTLTSFEFQLLRFLVERVSRVFTRQELLTRVWGYRHEGSGRSVDTHILNLRRSSGTWANVCKRSSEWATSFSGSMFPSITRLRCLQSAELRA